MTTSRALALRMILSAKAARASRHLGPAHFFAANPFREVLDDLADNCQTPEGVLGSLEAVCIHLAHLAADRWTEDEVMAEQVRELDRVQQVRAAMEFERSHPELSDGVDDDEEEGDQ